MGETPSRVSAPSPLSTGTSVGGAGPSSSSSSEVAPHEWPVPTDSAVAPRPRATVAPASSAVVAVTASSAGPAAVPAQPTTAVLAPGTRESVQRRIAAVTTAEDGTGAAEERRGADRVWTNTPVMATLSALGREIVLRHEVLHLSLIHISEPTRPY